MKLRKVGEQKKKKHRKYNILKVIGKIYKSTKHRHEIKKRETTEDGKTRNYIFEQPVNLS